MRLTAKITVLIVVVLIIGFGASTIFTIRRESDLLVEQSKESARRLIATVVASIEAAMLQERPDITRGLIQDLKSSSPVEGLTIYRRNGVEAFTDLATLREVSKEAELPKDVVASIEKMRREPGRTMTGPLFQRAVETLRTQEALETRDGVSLFVLNQPIANQERCQGCHGTDHKVRAVVRVATSMEPVLAQVAMQRNRQIMIAILTIVTAAAVLAVAMRFVVVRPIHELARVARRIGEGDFAGARPRLRRRGGRARHRAQRHDRAPVPGAARPGSAEHRAGRPRSRTCRPRASSWSCWSSSRASSASSCPTPSRSSSSAIPSATTLEKRNEEVSVLFLDIAGYTRLSEQLEAKRLNQLVQTYFCSFLEIIRAHHGDVNETAGDGLMVIFQRSNRAEPGRPDEDHALNATRAAFAIQARTLELNEEYAGVFPAIQLHMGINTGEALLGATKLGGAGSQRWTFTATGPDDQPGRALRRLAQGGDIVVGPETAERIKTRFVLEALGEKSFKNVSQPLPVFRVIPPGIYSGVRI